MTKLAAIFLSIVYTPLGLYFLYKAVGMTELPRPDAGGNAFWVSIGVMSLLVAGMAVFYLIRTARSVDGP